MLLRYLLILTALQMALGQSLIDLKTQTKDVDFTHASATSPLQAGTTLPATCVVGQMFYLTSTAAGVNVYGCTATNIWTQQGGSGGALQTSQLNDWSTSVDVGQTFVTWGSSCTLSNPCTVIVQPLTRSCAMNGGPYTATISGTHTLNAYVYVDSGCSMKILYGGGTSTGGELGGGGGVTAVFQSSPAYPAGVFPILQWRSSSTAGLWDSAAFSKDWGTFTAATPVSCGANLLCGQSGNQQTVAVDPTSSLVWTGAIDDSGAASTKPMGTAASAPASCTVGQFYFNSGSGHTFACTATNTWTQVDGGGGGGTVTEERSFYVGRDAAGNFIAPDTNASHVSGVGTTGDTASYTISNTGDVFVVVHTHLPSNWTGAVDAKILWFQFDGGTGSVQWTVSTGCVTPGSGNVFSFSYNTGQTITTPVNGASVLTASALSSITMTGCSAGDDLYVKLERANGSGDTYADGTAYVGAVITVRHS